MRQILAATAMMLTLATPLFAQAAFAQTAAASTPVAHGDAELQSQLGLAKAGGSRQCRSHAGRNEGTRLCRPRAATRRRMPGLAVPRRSHPSAIRAFARPPVPALPVVRRTAPIAFPAVAPNRSTCEAKRLHAVSSPSRHCLCSFTLRRVALHSSRLRVTKKDYPGTMSADQLDDRRACGNRCLSRIAGRGGRSAFTIVLAVATIRGKKPALLGTAAGLGFSHPAHSRIRTADRSRAALLAATRDRGPALAVRLALAAQSNPPYSRSHRPLHDEIDAYDKQEGELRRQAAQRSAGPRLVGQALPPSRPS